jgi:hypothetical protein
MQAAPEVPMDPGDRVDVHKRAAVDLPEKLRIELVRKLPDRLANECFAFTGGDHRVLAVGVEIVDLLDGDEPYVVAERRGDPTRGTIKLRFLIKRNDSEPDSAVSGTPKSHR